MTSASGAVGGDSIRVGDAERNAAIEALNTHLSAGRLDLNEYGTRSAQVNAARTVADLQAPFADLPAPHPAAPTGPSAAPVPAPPSAYPAPSAPQPVVRSRGQAIAVGVGASAGVIAVIAFFLLSPVWHAAWLVFLLIPVVYTITSAVTGVDVREAKRGRR